MESSASPDDHPPRIKLLCSFGGSILPRPLDGRLRYVGGETRIVSLPRHVSYPDLLSRMGDLFDGVSIIKYQQPDEDIDALVSVVNDDDVMNMMEEYDKLGAAGDGFTRLRIFLFPRDFDPAVAAALSSHFDADERETERRYVDALNSLCDTVSSPDVPERFLGDPSTDGGIPSHLNLHQINIPHPSNSQRYGEVEAPWSPAAYFSPAYQPPHDPREYPPSPSSSRYHLSAGEFNDRVDEFGRQLPGHLNYDHQPPQYAESMLLHPPGSVGQGMAGFPVNIGHGPSSVFEGGSVCEHCRIAFPRNTTPVSDPRYLDPWWKHGQLQMEQAATGNEYAAHFSNTSREFYQNREAYMLNPDVKLDNFGYVRDQSEQYHPFHNDGRSPDGGWIAHHHQVNHRLEEPRVQHSASGRVVEHYAVVDGHSMNLPLAPVNFYEGHSVPSNYISHDGNRFFRPGSELGTEMLHAQQTNGVGARTHMAGFEDTAARYGIRPSAYGADNLYQVQQNLPPISSLRRRAQLSMHPGTSYESTGIMAPNDGISSGFIRSPQEGSPKMSRIGVESQIQNSGVRQNCGTPQKIVHFDGSVSPEYLYVHSPRASQNFSSQDIQISSVPDSVQHQAVVLEVDVPAKAEAPLIASVDDKLVAAAAAFDDHKFSKMGSDVAPRMIVLEEEILGVVPCEATCEEEKKGTVVQASASSKEQQDLDFDAIRRQSVEKECQTVNVESSKTDTAKQHGSISMECLTFLPELIASVKKAALESAEVVKAKVEADADENETSVTAKKPSLDELDPVNADADLQADADIGGEHQKISKIEPTTAEAEALVKGLQTVRNDDLEQIRELGTGTYGAVYYGKWKGSDVAIKRIKASCFSGSPSERERLIADFWKEALILSSLHHPNVVSLYGVVRDGPDGSLATVTEFMVNGSLKQFLQKKDRTIDRRKRLILAMDAAFGMEYLHGKNIVHFDLKCENLLVNMRDPHRPVCKIGDLGLSKVKRHTLVSGGIRGTLPWMAPELLSGRSNMVTEKIDVYSFGIVLWELLTGEEPYADMHCASVIGGIVNNSLRPQIPTWCDPEWRSLMEGCWSSDPGERPSFSEISQKLRKMAAVINVK